MEVTVRAASPGPSSRMVRYSGAESLTPQQTAFRTRCSTCRISERCRKSESLLNKNKLAPKKLMYGASRLKSVWKFMEAVSS